jgi:hypothetical protein
MIFRCQFCLEQRVVNGPRNKVVETLCNKPSCRKRALIALKELDLLTPEEELELQTP